MSAAGTQVVRIKGDRVTQYTLQVVLNAAVEEYLTIARTGSSLNIDPSKLNLSPSARVAVMGHSEPKTLSVGAATAEPNDTFSSAVFSGIGIGTGINQYATNGAIGDNAALAAGLDVDIFAMQLDVSERLTIDINASTIGSTLDSFLTLFDSSGRIVAVNDDSNSSDSFIDFTPDARDTYYVGISGFANQQYDPFIAGTGFAGSTGTYEIRIERQGPPATGTSTVDLSLPDVDAFTFDLTEFVGKSVDILLTGLDGADLSGSALQLIGPNSCECRFGDFEFCCPIKWCVHGTADVGRDGRLRCGCYREAAICPRAKRSSKRPIKSIFWRYSDVGVPGRPSWHRSRAAGLRARLRDIVQLH
jgi:hypothetical protein